MTATNEQIAIVKMQISDEEKATRLGITVEEYRRRWAEGEYNAPAATTVQNSRPIDAPKPPKPGRTLNDDIADSTQASNLTAADFGLAPGVQSADSPDDAAAKADQAVKDRYDELRRETAEMADPKDREIRALRRRVAELEAQIKGERKVA
jgi:hypothetical protein